MKAKTLLKSLPVFILVLISSFSRFSEANQTLYNRKEVKDSDLHFLGADIIEEGDLVIKGTETYLIANGTFIRRGSIIVKDSAALIIQNACLTLELSYPMQHTITIEDYAKVTVQNSTLRTNNKLILKSFGECRIEIKDSEIHDPLITEFVGYSNVTISGSTVDDVEGGLFANISITESDINQTVACCESEPTFSVSNSTIDKIVAAFNCTIIIVDSWVGELSFEDSRHEDTPRVLLLSSKVDKIYPPIDEGIVDISWRLTVSVALNARPIEGATIEVLYEHNGSRARTETTGMDGKIVFTLSERIVYSTSIEYIGNYTVRASYMNILNQTVFELREDKQTEVTLVDAMKPRISDVHYVPKIPTEGQNVTIMATVVDDETGILNVTLKCSTEDGATWESMTMLHEANNTYSTTLPNQKGGVTAQFYLLAYDQAENYAETNMYSYSILAKPWWEQYWYIFLITGICVTLGYLLWRRTKARARLDQYLQRTQSRKPNVQGVTFRRYLDLHTDQVRF